MDMLNFEELNVLNQQLDQIEDLAGFEVPPNGRYKLKMSADIKSINDRPAVELSLEVMDTILLAKDDAKAPTNGTKFSLLFFVAGKDDAVKMSLGRLKELMLPVGEHYGEANMSQILARLKSEPLEVEAQVKRRADKEDPEKVYASLKNVVVC